MLRMLKTRPSPALVISLIALFVSLGGAGYAAVTVTGKDVKNSSLTGKDVKNSSLTGKDVKNSSLTGKDVKNRSLSGADVKDDGLGGTQILESQLGKVPAATNADNAGRAASAAAVDKLKTVGSYKRVTSSASDNDPNVARAAATQVPLFTVGPFDVYGKCFTDADAPTTFAEAYVKTHEDSSVLLSSVDTLNGQTAYLDTATLETNSQINAAPAGANTVATFTSFANEFFADSPSGTGVNGSILVLAKNGTPPGGNGIYGSGNVCLFSGFAAG